MTRAERWLWRLGLSVIVGGTLFFLLGFAYWLLTSGGPGVLAP